MLEGAGKNNKNGAIWCKLDVPKYIITKLKINNLKDNKSTTKIVSEYDQEIPQSQTADLITIFFSWTNLDLFVITKINTFRIYKGV